MFGLRTWAQIQQREKNKMCLIHVWTENMGSDSTEGKEQNVLDPCLD